MTVDGSYSRSRTTEQRHQSTVYLSAGMESFIHKLNMIDDTTWKLSMRKSVSQFLINQGLRHVFIGPCQALCSALSGLQQQQKLAI
jgi:hypothetical protein